MMERLIEMLHHDGVTLVLENGGVHTFSGRGVRDLYLLLTTRPGLLHGATLADKVVGKGAAALMILGGIKRLHAEVISEAALALLAGQDIEVSYREKVSQIWNRTRTGRCPVETLCSEAWTAEECLPLITEFITSKS